MAQFPENDDTNKRLQKIRFKIEQLRIEVRKMQNFSSLIIDK